MTNDEHPKLLSIISRGHSGRLWPWYRDAPPGCYSALDSQWRGTRGVNVRQPRYLRLVNREERKRLKMSVSLGRVRKYSLVPYLDRCPEYHGTYKVSSSIPFREIRIFSRRISHCGIIPMSHGGCWQKNGQTRWRGWGESWRGENESAPGWEPLGRSPSCRTLLRSHLPLCSTGIHVNAHNEPTTGRLLITPYVTICYFSRLCSIRDPSLGALAIYMSVICRAHTPRCWWM